MPNQPTRDGRDEATELADVYSFKAPSNTFAENSDIHDHKVHTPWIKYGNPATYSPLFNGEITAAVNASTKKLESWRKGLSVCVYAALAVLAVNLILTIWAAVHFSTSDGIGTAYEGDCDVASNTTLWLHAGINILSTILLTASTTTMQILNAPTRRELDQAHARGRWMDIGVLSMRNLLKIPRLNMLLFLLLAASSTPIHFLYNSTVFQTYDSNDYWALVVDPAFLLPGANFSGDYDSPEESAGSYQHIKSIQTTFADRSAYLDQTRFQNLSNHDCIAAYKTSFVSGRSNVLAITHDSDSSSNNTLFFAESVSVSEHDGMTPWSWICSKYSYWNDLCVTTTPRNNGTDWSVGFKSIDYCISETTTKACRVQFSLYMLVAVIACNAIKTACIFVTMWCRKAHKDESDRPILTVGDAVASYLEIPDELTRGRCLMSRMDTHKGPLRWEDGKQQKPNTTPVAKEYRGPLRRRWFAAASRTRWWVTIGLGAFALIACIGLLVPASVRALSYDYNSNASSFTVLWNKGFGIADLTTLLNLDLSTTTDANMMGAVLLANLPQVAVSYLYVLYTQLITCMLLSHEWSTYAVRHKGLRVTAPRPYSQQRDTYFLSLPYKYKIPLTLASVLTHWLVSSAFFYVHVFVYRDGVLVPENEISDVGFSCAPMICILFFGFAFILAVVGLGFRKFASSMPVASYCSVAIAAACHPPSGDRAAAYEKVQWGDVSGESRDFENDALVRHCTFTSQDVQPLIPTRMYAGS